MSILRQQLAAHFQREALPFIVSRTRRTHPLWRYLWPYRSANHFILTMFSAIAVWTIQGVFLPDHGPNHFTPVGLLFLLIFVPLMIPFDELPGKVTIATEVPAHRLLDDIRAEMAERGYVLEASVPSHPGHLHFRPTEKVEFSPMGWIEQDVDVHLRDDATIEIHGSKVDLSKLIHCLKRRYKKQRRVLA